MLRLIVEQVLNQKPQKLYSQIRFKFIFAIVLIFFSLSSAFIGYQVRSNYEDSKTEEPDQKKSAKETSEIESSDENELRNYNSQRTAYFVIKHLEDVSNIKIVHLKDNKPVNEYFLKNAKISNAIWSNTGEELAYYYQAEPDYKSFEIHTMNSNGLDNKKVATIPQTDEYWGVELVGYIPLNNQIHYIGTDASDGSPKTGTLSILDTTTGKSEQKNKFPTIDLTGSYKKKVISSFDGLTYYETGLNSITKYDLSKDEVSKVFSVPQADIDRLSKLDVLDGARYFELGDNNYPNYLRFTYWTESKYTYDVSEDKMIPNNQVMPNPNR